MVPQQWDDDRLFAELAEALRLVGDVPERFVRAGEAAYTWRTVDEELAWASLSYDSERDHDLTVRGTATADLRTIVFDAAGLSVELELHDGSLIGQLVPSSTGRVTVHAPDGETQSVVADELGCFSVALPGSRIRLTCQTEAAGMVTGWIDV